jgi:hypothetical protein
MLCSLQNNRMFAKWDHICLFRAIIRFYKYYRGTTRKYKMDKSKDGFNNNSPSMGWSDYTAKESASYFSKQDSASESIQSVKQKLPTAMCDAPI